MKDYSDVLSRVVIELPVNNQDTINSNKDKMQNIRMAIRYQKQQIESYLKTISDLEDQYSELFTENSSITYAIPY